MERRYYLPRVTERHYEAFRTLMGDRVHTTYAEWTEFMDFRRHDEAMRHPVVDVDVDPDEFAGFCRSSGYAFDYGTLVRYISEKARHGI